LSVSVEDWIRDIEKQDFIVFDGSPVDGADCIIKVCSETVHNSLVLPMDNWSALEEIKRMATPQLKAELGKTVLACAFASRRCTVTLMKMLSSWDNEPQRNSCAPSTFASPLLCWEAFIKLVRSVLLPLANIDVVHTDIRFDPRKKCFCNIVVDAEASQPREFRLIDFESLVILRQMDRIELQDYAISLGHFRGHCSPHEFVFWQVLWMAYVWCPMTTSDTLVIAEDFVDHFFSTKRDMESLQNGLRTIQMTDFVRLVTLRARKKMTGP
jgi:hypothetical protein